jgi:TonB family protein
MKKTCYLLLIFWTSAFFSSCATKNRTQFKRDPYISWLQENQLKHPSILDVRAQFPGGNDALAEFLKHNIKYPDEAREKGIQGVVSFSFIIEKDGSVSNAKVRNDSNTRGGISEEIIRVIEQMPKWKPGIINREPVRVGMAVPVEFSLNESSAIVIPPVFDEETRAFYFPHQDRVSPQFPGGEEARVRYLINNVRYPDYARANDIQGTVVLAFIVEKDGRVSNVEVLRSVDKRLDREAVRVVRRMPRWTPGTADGKPVRVSFSMPIAFRLR